MTTTYQPRVGSIGERSMAYLRVHGRAVLRDLADAIDADFGSMTASLNLCVTNDLIVREDADGCIYFRLPAAPSAEQFDGVDGKQAEPPAAAIAPAAEPVPTGSESVAEILRDELAGSLASPADVRESANARTDFEIRESLRRRGDLAPAADKRHFEFGLFSDGRFVIELADTVATLTRDETDRLYQFFRKVDAVGSLA